METQTTAKSAYTRCYTQTFPLIRSVSYFVVVVCVLRVYVWRCRRCRCCCCFHIWYVTKHTQYIIRVCSHFHSISLWLLQIQSALTVTDSQTNGIVNGEKYIQMENKPNTFGWVIFQMELVTRSLPVNFLHLQWILSFLLCPSASIENCTRMKRAFTHTRLHVYVCVFVFFSLRASNHTIKWKMTKGKISEEICRYRL